MDYNGRRLLKWPLRSGFFAGHWNEWASRKSKVRDKSQEGLRAAAASCGPLHTIAPEMTDRHPLARYFGTDNEKNDNSIEAFDADGGRSSIDRLWRVWRRRQ